MLNCTRPYPVHVLWDPAIDLAESDYDGYLNTRDPACLKFLPDATPQTFWCRPIRNDTAVRKMMGLPIHEAQIFAFKWAVYRVDNAYLWDGRVGVSVRPSVLDKHEADLGDGGVPPHRIKELWSDAELNQCFDPTTRLEVGEVIRALTFLPPGIEPGFTLPPTSQQLLLGQGRLLAAMLQSRSKESSSEDTSDETSASDDESAPDGDATAAAANEMQTNILARSMFASQQTGQP